MEVENSISPPFIGKDGHAFKVQILKATSVKSKQSDHQKNQKFKHRTKFQNSDRNVQSATKIVIPPETSVTVPVLANFPAGSNHLYVEKVFSWNRNPDNLYAPPGDVPQLTTSPTQNSTSLPPFPALFPTLWKTMLIPCAISHRVLSSGSRSLYPKRMMGGSILFFMLDRIRLDSVCMRKGNEAVL
jgi:hypothetical protein